jgi:hypothetical protein
MRSQAARTLAVSFMISGCCSKTMSRSFRMVYFSTIETLGSLIEINPSL